MRRGNERRRACGITAPRRGWVAGPLALSVVLGACGGPPAAPEPPRAPELAAVSGAPLSVGLGAPLVALSASPLGRGRLPEALLVLTAEGVRRVQWSPLGLGPLADAIGAGDVEAPRGLDATNGQDLYVADGDRVLRFSDEGLLVQTLRVPAVDRLGVAAPEAAAPGEAVAVAAGPDGAVFVAEASRGAVQVWQGGQLVDVLGGFESPLALVVRGRRLFVLDRLTLHVRDTSGAPLASVSAAGALALAPLGDGVMRVSQRDVEAIAPSGDRLWRTPLVSAAPVLGAAVVGETLFVLTPEALTAVGTVPRQRP